MNQLFNWPARYSVGRLIMRSPIWVVLLIIVGYALFGYHALAQAPGRWCTAHHCSSDPNSACKLSWTYSSAYYTTPTQYACKDHLGGQYGAVFLQFECPADSVYNMDTGECDSEEPDCSDGLTWNPVLEQCEDDEGCPGGSDWSTTKYCSNPSCSEWQCRADCPSGSNWWDDGSDHGSCTSCSGDSPVWWGAEIQCGPACPDGSMYNGMECVDACVPGFCYEVGITGGSCVPCDDGPEDNPPPDDEPPVEPPDPPDDPDDPDDDPPPPDEPPPDEPDDSSGPWATQSGLNTWGRAIVEAVNGNTMSMKSLFRDQNGYLKSLVASINVQIDKSGDRIVDSLESNTTDLLNQLHDIELAISDANQRLADAIAEGEQQQADALQDLLDGLADELDEALGAEPGLVTPIEESVPELPSISEYTVDWESEVGRPEIPEEHVKTWAEIAAVISDGFSAAPLGQAIESLSFSVPDSSGCEPWTESVPFFGQTLQLTVDSHCQIWPQLAPIISAISVMAYSFVAVRAFIR